MVQEVENFARFYAILGKMQFGYDGLKEEFKERIVSQSTGGRTSSLREMTRKEYDTMCNGLEELQGDTRAKWREELKRQRSICLKLMGQIGVDTTDWQRVNDFCKHPRICGKAFREIDTEELEHLAVKLRSIKRRGGLKPKKEAQSESKRQPLQVLTIVLPKNDQQPLC